MTMSASNLEAKVLKERLDSIQAQGPGSHQSRVLCLEWEESKTMLRISQKTLTCPRQHKGWIGQRISWDNKAREIPALPSTCLYTVWLVGHVLRIYLVETTLNDPIKRKTPKNCSMEWKLTDRSTDQLIGSVWVTASVASELLVWAQFAGFPWNS